MGSGRKGSSQRIAPATSITEAGRRDARLFAPAFEADWVLVVVFAVLSTPGRGGYVCEGASSQKAGDSVSYSHLHFGRIEYLTRDLIAPYGPTVHDLATKQL